MEVSVSSSPQCREAPGMAMASSAWRFRIGCRSVHAGSTITPQLGALEGKQMLPINWLAVIVAAIIRMAVGFAWYSPPVLLKPWQAVTGVTPETMRAGMGKALAIDIVGS